MPFFKHLKFFLWKEYRQTRANCAFYVTCIVIPILLITVYQFSNMMKKLQSHPDIYFKPFNVSENKYNDQINELGNQIQIIWSPCNKDALNPFMSNLNKKMNTINWCVRDFATLEVEISASKMLCGIDFGDHMDKSSSLRNLKTIKFLFPWVLRHPTAEVELLTEPTWYTSYTFPPDPEPGPRQHTYNNGANPVYHDEGFLMLEYHLLVGLIEDIKAELQAENQHEKMQEDTKESKNKTKREENTENTENLPSLKLPNILMQRFPYPSWFYRVEHDTDKYDLGFFIYLLFTSPMVFFVNNLCNYKTIRAMPIVQKKDIFILYLARFIKMMILLIPCDIIQLYIVIVIFNLSMPIFIILLILFNLSLISTCIAISAISRTVVFAESLAFTLFLLSSIFFNTIRTSHSVSLRLTASMFCYPALSIALETMIDFQSDGALLNIGNLFDTSSCDISVGTICLFLIINIFFYIIIALYAETVTKDTFGISRPWYFPFGILFGFTNWHTLQNKIRVFFKLPPIRKQRGFKTTIKLAMYQEDPKHGILGIEALKLTRKEGYRVVIDEVSMRIFKGEITFLLGQCGSGKSSLLDMLSGTLKPTSGAAFIEGVNIKKQYKRIRNKIGIHSAKQNLYDNITVKEHIALHCYYRGLGHSDTEIEIEYYTSILLLVEKLNVCAKYLSDDAKTRLSVILALCGNTQFVFLDEPTIILDPSSRKAMWDILDEEKKNRVIVITTQTVEEADLLGDRIAILVDGILKAYGTTLYLKKNFSSGYYINFIKMDICRVDVIARMIKGMIPSAQLTKYIGASISYYINESFDMVKDLLKRIEANSDKIGILNYQVRIACLEDIFVQICSDLEKKIDTSNEPILISKHKILKGVNLYFNQMASIYLKRLIQTSRYFGIPFIQVVLPVIWIAVGLNFTRVSEDINVTHCFKMSEYEHPITPVAGSSLYKDNYVKFVGGKILHIDGDYEKALMQEARPNTKRLKYRHNFIVGAKFSENEIIAYFNNIPYHSPPLALFNVLSAIAITELGKSNWNINLCNNPIRQTLSTKMKQIASFSQKIPMFLVAGLIVPFSLFACYYADEKINSVRKIYQFSGLSVWVNILGNVSFDFVIVTYISCCTLLALISFNEDGYRNEINIGICFVVMLVFGTTTVIMSYLTSFFVSTKNQAFIFMFCFGSVGLLAELSELSEHFPQVMHMQYISPYMLFTSSLKTMYALYLTQNWCNTYVENCFTETKMPKFICEESACRTSELCCYLKKNYFSFSDGIAWNLVHYAILDIVGLLLIYCFEVGFFAHIKLNIMKKLIYKFKKLPQYKPYDEVVNPSSTQHHHHHDKNAIVVKNVTIGYGKKLVLENMTFEVEKGKCLGLLGYNGTGKSSLCKILINQMHLTSGKVIINKNPCLKKKQTPVHYIGFCPQLTNAMCAILTPYETLTIYAMFKGIPDTIIPSLVKSYALEFDFVDFQNHQIAELSRGVQQKVLNALAFIGEPYIIVLDEPTQSMDLSSKYIIWNNIMKARDRGQTILLTSTNVEECETVCNIIGILVNGTMKSIGDIQYLKQTYSEGYYVEIKVHCAKKTQDDNEVLFQINDYVSAFFEKCNLIDTKHCTMKYNIGGDHLWADIFQVLEDAKLLFHSIESFTISLNTINQVFSILSRAQRRISLYNYELS